MSPDDHRHHTNRGYIAGCREDCCRTAHADYRRGLRAKRYLLRVDRLYVPALGTKRRIRALQAIGWRLGDIDQALGHPFRSSWSMNVLRQEAVHLDTERAVAALYERLSMSFGPSTLVRTLARGKGWPPPLAWDDDSIDDPAAEPRGVGYIDPDRATALTEFDALGLGITEVCARLGVRRDNLERWCQRHAMNAVYQRFTGRETWVEVAS